MKTAWRDCKGWRDSHLPMTSASDEASKWFDASLTQITSMYADDEAGGVANSFKNMMEADPDFVMGQVFVNSMKFGGSKTETEEVHKMVDNISAVASKQKVTERESKHVAALKLVTEGKLIEAAEVYRAILAESPTDLLACLLAFFKYYELGMFKEMLDMMKSVVKGYTPETPGYSTVLGWKAFAHEENCQLNEAEEEAYKSLAVSPRETFAIHTMAHVHLEKGMYDAGLAFLQSKEKYWANCSLACHIAWHEALFHLEKGQFDDAVQTFDDKIINRGNFNDAASLLYRLSFEGVRVPEKWRGVLELVDKFSGHHTWIYTDLHILFTLYRAGERERANELLEALKEYVTNNKGTNAQVTHDVGMPLCAGITAFEEEHYETATNCLKSVYGSLQRIGGSNAQRDTFVQLLLHSAIRSPNPDHKALARTLLAERRSRRVADPLGDRLQRGLEESSD
uniref:Tetratricopeptide repeat protein 38 n=1 Tax=Crassostrea virginica TaxID=6565 RepID=A0A8B8ES25_CRAVI|nr:tetratricopeptide repeat protein 38-like isoform X2 [Crassostrea virginica]